MSQAERAHASGLRAAIEDVVYRGALHLDERRFGDWLDLTSSDFRYRIEAYSPDIRRQMTWIDHDRQGMAALVELLPKHHVNGAIWLRHVVVYSVQQEDDTNARAVSSLAVFHTVVDVGDSHVEGGSSRLFLVGRYYDRFRREEQGWRLSERVVRLDTRQLGVGSHVFP
jgi:methanesulfonate monooxygenase subunit beta